jgi:RNA polymerase sigma-70 factor, ECF subfamily
LSPSQYILDEMSEKALLALFVEGNAQAFEHLLHRREKWLWNVAKKSIRDPSLAEEALQEALISIWKHAEGFRGDSELSTWLYQIVTRSCIDVLRKEQIRSHQSLGELENLESIGGATSFEEALMDELLVHSALLEIDPDQRRVIEMLELDGLSVEEISSQLGIPAGTVKSRSARGREALKKIIQKNVDFSRNQRPVSNVIPLGVKNAKK